MSDFIMSALIGLAFVLIAIMIVLGSYFLARKLLSTGNEGDRTHDAASTVAVRIAALHGLILALVYAQELDDYKGVRSVLTEEAISISDIFNDIRRYGGPDVTPVQVGLAQYVTTVVSKEWDSLGKHEGLLAQAWIEWQSVYELLLNLEPSTERERFLAERMRERITSVARDRQLREATAGGGFSGLFWGPALIGLCLVAVPFYVFRPTRTHIVLLSIFGIYSGVILFFIFAFSNPFHQPGRLEPKAFNQLLKGDLGKIQLPAGS